MIVVLRQTNGEATVFGSLHLPHLQAPQLAQARPQASAIIRSEALQLSLVCVIYLSVNELGLDFQSIFGE
jgi:hypothetical protein